MERPRLLPPEARVERDAVRAPVDLAPPEERLAVLRFVPVLRLDAALVPPERDVAFFAPPVLRELAALVPREAVLRDAVLREEVAFFAAPVLRALAVRVPLREEVPLRLDAALVPREVVLRDEVPPERAVLAPVLRAVFVPALRAVLVPVLRAVFVPVLRAVLVPGEREEALRVLPADFRPPLAAAAVRPAAPRRVVPDFAAPPEALLLRRVPLLRRFGFCSVSAAWPSPCA